VIYVCDTHAFIWWATQKRPLGAKASRAFRRAERGLDEIRLPAAAAFEIALLLERGRLRSRLGWDDWLDALRSTRNFAVEPLVLDDVAHARDMKPLVDPFDRLITATARRLGAPLITSDERIVDSRLVEIAWR